MSNQQYNSNASLSARGIAALLFVFVVLVVISVLVWRYFANTDHDAADEHQQRANEQADSHVSGHVSGHSSTHVREPSAPTGGQLHAQFVSALHSRPFAQPLDNLSDAQIDRMMLGRSFFSIPWVVAPSATTARDGLGPLFNANTCSSCHPDNGATAALNTDGTPMRALLFKLGQPKQHSLREPDSIAYPDPAYGLQIAIHGTGTVPAEAQPRIEQQTIDFRYPDGQTLSLTRFVPQLDALGYGDLAADTVIGIRQAPPLVGLGLVARLDEASLQANLNRPEYLQDGISGRIHYVYDRLTGKPAIGKYGWRATQPTLMQQIADAAANDMGLTNPLYPNELCSEQQTACQQAPRGRTTLMGELDLPMLRLQGITDYLKSFMAIETAPLDAQAKRGQQLFAQFGCASCHQTQMTTKDGIVFAPYSDFLLHDMGEGLADERLEFAASRREWRTAPLWGLGQRIRTQQRFLHDARAATPEQAILWHDGEAHIVKQRFVHADAEDRADLLHFLQFL